MYAKQFKSGNWTKGFTTEAKMNYEAVNSSNRLGIENIILDKGSQCSLLVHFCDQKKLDSFVETFSYEVDIIGSLRRASTMSQKFGTYISTDNVKSIGLLLRTIHQSLPFSNNDINDLIRFCDLPEDAFEDTHNYNTCTLF